MRSLEIFGIGRERVPAFAGTGNRPEILRRKTIANNARLLIAFSAIVMVPAMYGLMTGAALPFVLACMMLAGGAASLSLHQKGLFDVSAISQAALLLACGLVLMIADSRLADPGMAMALMGPVLAALVARRYARRLSWIGLGAVVAISLLAYPLALSGAEAERQMLTQVSIAGLLAAIGLVCYSAHRISSAYEVSDKSQISAYRHLIEHVQDAVLRFAGDGTILMASRSTEALFGCPRYQLAGGGLGERLHVLDRPAYLTAFADANQDGRSRTIEVRMRQDDPRAASSVPRFIWVEMRFSPITDCERAGGRFEVIALLRDVTARKDAEAAMADARRVAEDASQAKSRFLATIGHELRTPLNAVVGFSEMMTSGIGGDMSATHREYAGLIHQSGKHLLEVVNMLLDMSKIEAGRFEIHTDAVQPEDIVPACLSMVESMAQQRQVRLVSEIEDGLPLLIADERVCRQIMINLLSNAIKFSHEGGLVTVSVRRQGQSINFSVRDRGIGMAPDAVQRIGEPFFQVQDGLTRKYEGTGLGLSIVKGLAELHGGTLRAMSEIGAGTTITVLLPINGPATKQGETADVLHLHREPNSAPPASWPKEQRKAQ